MERDSSSFSADIRKFEDTLAKDPGSYCFAPLAELYRKAGRLDDAIHAAKRGCELHPDYVGGYMALGRAYLEKGMKAESRDAFEKVVAITPDNLLAQKLLNQIYVDQGDTASAERTLKSIPSQSPFERESQELPDALETGAPLGSEAFQEPADERGSRDQASIAWGAEGAFVPVAEEEIDLEDAEIIEELSDEDMIVEDEFVVAPVAIEFPVQEGGDFSEEKNPLSTVTLAELYVSQGFLERALTIYEELLAAEPDNLALKKRYEEVHMAMGTDTVAAGNTIQAVAGGEPDSAAELDHAESPRSEMVKVASTVTDDRVLETLEKWLDSIRRRQ